VGLGRQTLAQRFVRSLLVELAAEGIEAALWSAAVTGGGVIGFGLERALHAVRWAEIGIRLKRLWPRT
jgi:hypothetical protein